MFNKQRSMSAALEESVTLVVHSLYEKKKNKKKEKNSYGICCGYC